MKTYRLVATVLGLGLAVFLYSCSTADSTSPGDGSGGESSGAIIATETPKRRAATDVRDSYGIFTIKTGGDTYTDYHLAVKEASATAPTATEMASGALKRNLSSNEIHVLIAQRMNAPMVEFAEKYFADNTHKTLGTDMTSAFTDDKDAGTVYDATATGTDAWVKESVLKSATEYALYGMPDGGTKVSKLLTFTTDAMAAKGSTGAADDEIVYIDGTLERGHISIAVNPAERYIFPIHYDTGSGTDILIFQLFYSQKRSDNLHILIGNMTSFGSVPGGYEKMFYMARNRTGGSTPTADDGLKAYVLFDTSDLTADFWYGSNLTIRGKTSPPTILYSTLSPQ